MKRTTIVNIYNFIRMSHQEPSVFLQADFDTIARQILLLKQYGLPSTFALKYDALMEPRYQKLLLENTDENDEIGAWWEITEPLCIRADVPFPKKDSALFDERVDSAYSVGYTPEQRCRLVDAYMADFFTIFHRYPKTIGSWVLDSVTLSYAHEHYGICGAAICRDQVGTDGFTLWGGYPNGIYYPSRDNEFMPAQTSEKQLQIAMFRLLSPDPVYSFEQDVRAGLRGVYTLEPVCSNGRDPARISWYFSTLTGEDGSGISYAQVGQENNFLWENIQPGFAPQLEHLRSLSEQGLVRIETMAESSHWFLEKYTLTPPMVWQAAAWDAVPADSVSVPEADTPVSASDLEVQWYASRHYRLGMIFEGGHLRIRDWFLFQETYPSRYLHHRLGGGDTPLPIGNGSTFDALPLLFAQKWMGMPGCPERPFVRLLESSSVLDNRPATAVHTMQEASGTCRFTAPDKFTARAVLQTDACEYRFTFSQNRLLLEGPSCSSFALCFDFLPVLCQADGRTLLLKHEGFSYRITLESGTALYTNAQKLFLYPENGQVRLLLAPAYLDAAEPDDLIFSEQYRQNPSDIDSRKPRWMLHPTPMSAIPAFAPVFTPAESVFPLPHAAPAAICLSVPEKEAQLFYTTDESAPVRTNPLAQLYQAPILLSHDTCLQAASCLPDGRSSETACSLYRFGWKDVILTSDTIFDMRPTFCCSGIQGLLESKRGSLDYQDRRWLGTLQDLDFICMLPEERLISVVEVGFLTAHRTGIIYPEFLELYVGDDEASLTLFDRIVLPCQPAGSETEKKDFGFRPNVRARCIRFVAHRYEYMPQWCCYKGVSGVFTLADNLIIR